VTLEPSSVRVYLTGRVCLEGAVLVDQAGFPGRQGRLAFTCLVAERHHPVPLDHLAAAVWGDRLPASWDTSLRAIVSKLRSVLSTAAPQATIASDAGCYQAKLGEAWVDIEAAANAIDRAEGALRAAELADAWSQATVAAGIARRPVLPGEDLPWVTALRGRVRGVRVRAVDVLTQVHLARADHPLAVAMARELIDLEPYREAGYRHLMRAHAMSGDRAEALRVYGGLRELLRDDLGVDPDPETRRVFERCIGAEGLRRPDEGEVRREVGRGERATDAPTSSSHDVVELDPGRRP
jgi:SARP family transcriptional regulator, regulator of embCAB operon